MHAQGPPIPFDPPRDDRHGTFNVVWTDDGRPLDTWERDVGQVREHAVFVAGKVEELRVYVESLQSVLFGRETGPRFWHRFDANLAALERVVERDVMCADVLVQLAEREELCSHKLRPVLGVTLLHGLGTIPDPAGGGGPKAKPPRLIVQGPPKHGVG